MSASNAGDLEVVLSAANTEETRSEIESVNETLEESADSMEDNANEMSGLQRRIQGLGGAIVAGLAVIAGGVLSQVPVIGEAFSGLMAIVDALSLRIDSKLRPALQGVVTGLFDIAGAIAEGDWSEVGNIIANAVSSLGDINWEGIAEDIVREFFALIRGVDWVTLGQNIIQFLVTGIVGAIGTQLSVLQTVATTIADEIGDANWTQIGKDIVNFVVDGVTGLSDFVTTKAAQFVGWITSAIDDINWKQLGKDIVNFVVDGVMGLTDFVTQKATQFVSWITDEIDEIDWEQLGKDIVNFVIDGLTSIPETISRKVGGVASDIKDELTDTDWVQVGKNLVQDFIDGIQDKIQSVKDVVNDLAQAVRDRMPGSDAETGPLSNLSETGPGLVDTFASGISDNAGRVSQATEGMAANANGGMGAASGDGGGILANRNQTIQLLMDGRETSRVTRQYAATQTDIRGRFGSN